VSFTAVFDLKEIIRQKKHVSIFQIMTIRTTITAGETVEVRIDIPDDLVWLMVGDVHDVPAGVFRHECRKDGFTVLDMVIHSDNMEIPYTIPFLVEQYLEGEFENLTDADEDFKLSIWIATMQRDYHARLLREIEFEDEIKKLMVDIWEQLTLDEKKRMVEKWMKRMKTGFMVVE